MGCQSEYHHYSDVIMSPMVSPITSLTIVYSTVYSGADQRKHQSSASLVFCEGNSLETGEFPAQRASNAENVSIWWRHHDGETLPWCHRTELHAEPCITTVIWPCCKTFSQWQCSFHWKLHSHWLKGLQQCPITVVIHGLDYQVTYHFQTPLKQISTTDK